MLFYSSFPDVALPCGYGHIDVSRVRGAYADRCAGWIGGWPYPDAVRCPGEAVGYGLLGAIAGA